MHLLLNFFFPNIKKHLDFMSVRNFNVNIYLRNDKLCLKHIFKESYFHPTRIPYIPTLKKKCIQLFVGETIQEGLLWH